MTNTNVTQANAGINALIFEQGPAAAKTQAVTEQAQNDAVVAPKTLGKKTAAAAAHKNHGHLAQAANMARGLKDKSPSEINGLLGKLGMTPENAQEYIETGANAFGDKLESFFANIASGFGLTMGDMDSLLQDPKFREFAGLPSDIDTNNVQTTARLLHALKTTNPFILIADLSMVSNKMTYSSQKSEMGQMQLVQSQMSKTTQGMNDQVKNIKDSEKPKPLWERGLKMVAFAVVGLAVGAVIGTLLSAAAPLAMAALGVVGEALFGLGSVVGEAATSLFVGGTEVVEEEMVNVVAEEGLSRIDEEAGRKLGRGASEAVGDVAVSATEVAEEGSSTMTDHETRMREHKEREKTLEALSEIEDDAVESKVGGADDTVGDDPASGKSSEKKGFKQRVADGYKELGDDWKSKLYNCVFSKKTKGIAGALGLSLTISEPMRETQQLNSQVSAAQAAETVDSTAMQALQLSIQMLQQLVTTNTSYQQANFSTASQALTDMCNMYKVSNKS